MINDLSAKLVVGRMRRPFTSLIVFFVFVLFYSVNYSIAAPEQRPNTDVASVIHPIPSHPRDVVINAANGLVFTCATGWAALTCVAGWAALTCAAGRAPS